MQLYLVQHGLAKSKEEDPDRPLNTQGRDESLAMAKAMPGKFTPAAICHSGKARARQTAEIFAEQLNASSTVEEAGNLSPNDDPAVWLNRIREISEDLMLVGHLPHLSRLASLILTGDPDATVVRFANSGVVCLESDEDGDWALAWILVPALIQ